MGRETAAYDTHAAKLGEVFDHFWVRMRLSLKIGRGQREGVRVSMPAAHTSDLPRICTCLSLLAHCGAGPRAQCHGRGIMSDKRDLERRGNATTTPRITTTTMTPLTTTPTTTRCCVRGGASNSSQTSPAGRPGPWPAARCGWNPRCKRRRGPRLQPSGMRLQQPKTQKGTPARASSPAPASPNRFGGIRRF